MITLKGKDTEAPALFTTITTLHTESCHAGDIWKQVLQFFHDIWNTNKNVEVKFGVNFMFLNNYTSVNMNCGSKSDQITKQTLNWAIFTGKTFWDELVVNNGKNVVKVMLYLLESLFLQPCLGKFEEHLGIKKSSRHLNTGLNFRIEWLFFRDFSSRF